MHPYYQEPRFTDLTEMRDQLGRVMSEVEMRGQRVIIRRRGRPVAALIPMGDFEALDEASRKELDYKKFQVAEKMLRWETLQKAVKEGKA